MALTTDTSPSLLLINGTIIHPTSNSLAYTQNPQNDKPSFWRTAHIVTHNKSQLHVSSSLRAALFRHPAIRQHKVEGYTLNGPLSSACDL